MKKTKKYILQRIMSYCQEISNTVDKVSFDDFIKDDNFEKRNSCAFCLIQIGELSKTLNDDFKSKYSKVKWKDWVFIRNYIAHNYEEFSMDRVWRISRENIPKLLKYTQEILSDINKLEKKAEQSRRLSR